MSKNNLAELNNILFDELRRLEKIDTSKLDSEVLRAKALCGVATQILQGGKLIVSAAVAKSNDINGDMRLPLLEE